MIESFWWMGWFVSLHTSLHVIAILLKDILDEYR